MNILKIIITRMLDLNFKKIKATDKELFHVDVFDGLTYIGYYLHEKYDGKWYFCCRNHDYLPQDGKTKKELLSKLKYCKK